MNQGLTQIENALLSEEEKQIRLRQRGLAWWIIWVVW
jgi:hypothetical protein